MDLRARLLGVADREAALAYLARDARANLLLLDLTARLGAPPVPGEGAAEVAGAWRAGEMIGVAGLRPSVIFDASAEAETIEAFLPYLDSLGVGLVKGSEEAVDLLWKHLGRRRKRRLLVDRLETTYALGSEELLQCAPSRDAQVRAARETDFEPLVVAARESLREEQRPDPFEGDPEGFRLWVRGRLGRARVVEAEGRIAFAGYADVRRPEGWLLQGIYTFPDFRRRGFARVGVSEMCREAFAAGADHVQLAVVDGNVAGRRLYEGLGFRPFAKLRTILFS